MFVRKIIHSNVIGVLAGLLFLLPANSWGADCQAGGIFNSETPDVCWYLGDVGESCDQVCEERGSYHEETRTFAGYPEGTGDQCQEILDHLGAPDAPFTEDVCWCTEQGCLYDQLDEVRIRCTNYPTTDSSYDPWSRRACACFAETEENPLGYDILFVSNDSLDEQEIESRLRNNFKYNVTKKRDHEVDSNTDLSEYDLVIITGFAPFISCCGLDNIYDSELPVFIIEGYDYWYSYWMWLVNSWYDFDYYYGDSAIISDDRHPITKSRELDSSIELYEQPSWSFNIPVESLEPNTEVLVKSEPTSCDSSENPMVIVNSDRKIVSTGIFDILSYTSESWELFDRTLCYLTDSCKDWIDLEDVGLSVPLDEEAISLRIDNMIHVEELRKVALAINKEIWAKKPLAPGVPKAVPSSLSTNPEDPDWVYLGYSIEMTPEEEKEYRKAVRLVNGYLLKLEEHGSEQDFLEYVEKNTEARKAWMRIEYKNAGQFFDERDDLSVAITRDGEIWLKKRPVDYYEQEGSPIPDGAEEQWAFGESYDWSISVEEYQAQMEIDMAQEDIWTTEENGGVPIDFDVGFSQSPASYELMPKDSQCHYDDPSIDFKQIRSLYNNFSTLNTPYSTWGAIVNNSNSFDNNPCCGHKCTGTKISPRVILTAGHCIYTGGQHHDTNYWVPGMDGIWATEGERGPSNTEGEKGPSNPATPLGYFSVKTRVVYPNYYWNESYYYDMGILALYDTQSSCNLPVMAWGKDTNLQHDYVHVYGFPGNGSDEQEINCNASPRNDERCGGSIYGMGTTVHSAGINTIEYHPSTYPAQSGSGVWKQLSSGKKVVAVHTACTDNHRRAVFINKWKKEFIEDAHRDHMSCDYCEPYCEECSNETCLYGQQCCPLLDCDLSKPTKPCIAI